MTVIRQEVAIVNPSLPLTSASFQHGLQVLLARDADLAGVVDRHGPPPFWRRKPSFATLVRIILEQQVSLASAYAVYKRLAEAVRPFSATHFRKTEPERLQQAGLTRQKLAYCYHLADAIAQRRISLSRLNILPDEEVRKALLQVKGIGPWSADIYLLMVLRRPDVWPRGDLALKASLASVKHLSARPTEAAFEAIGEPWRPWRAIAARILWHDYLASRKGVPANLA